MKTYVCLRTVLAPLLCAITTLLYLAACETTKSSRATVTDAHSLKDGDVVFQDSHSSQSEDIKAITNSSFCHVGVYFKEGGIGYIYHAGSPVQRVTFESWIGDGKGFGDARRLRAEGLTSDEASRLRMSLRQHLGKRYDSLFQPDREKLYCSEYVFLAYQEANLGQIGKWQRFSDLPFTPKVRERLEQRYAAAGKKFRDDTLVITPESLRHGSLIPAR